MGRGVPLLSLVLALLVGGVLWNAQASQTPKPNREIRQAQQAATAVTFQQAQVALDQFHALNGTYVGTSLAGFGVKLARADATSYCIQAGSSHLAGPGGTAAAGPC
jgi:hypothetical protein